MARFGPVKRPAVLLGALLLLCAAASCSAQNETTDPNIPFFGRTIQVCTSSYAPMVFCGDRPVELYDGYETQMFKNVADKLGWKPEYLNWSCLAWDDMMESMATGDGRCDLAVAGIGVRTKYINMGLTFTTPTLRGGFAIMVSSETSGTNYWAFLDAFSATLWLAIVLTCIGIGVVIWGIEWWAGYGRIKRPGDPLPHTLEKQVFIALGRPMQTVDMEARSTAANTIIIIFAFMVLILVNIYTANTAANLTAYNLKTQINSIQDLQGKVVGSWSNYVPLLQMRNVEVTKTYPWDNTADEVAMVDAVAAGDVQALVLDAPVLHYYSTKRCDVIIVGAEFDQNDQAHAFPAGFNNSELLTAYNKALALVREEDVPEQLVNKWMYSEPPCKSRGMSETTNKVQFDQVAGLWILLAGSIGVACLLALAHQIAVFYFRKVSQTQVYQQSVTKLRGAVSRHVGSKTVVGRSFAAVSGRRMNRLQSGGAISLADSALDGGGPFAATAGYPPPCDAAAALAEAGGSSGSGELPPRPAGYPVPLPSGPSGSRPTALPTIHSSSSFPAPARLDSIGSPPPPPARLSSESGGSSGSQHVAGYPSLNGGAAAPPPAQPPAAPAAATAADVQAILAYCQRLESQLTALTAVQSQPPQQQGSAAGPDVPLT